jgi:hypothetical protein
VTKEAHHPVVTITSESSGLCEPPLRIAHLTVPPSLLARTNLDIVGIEEL